MSDINCMKCCVHYFKIALCEGEFCKKYHGEGTEDDFLKKLTNPWILCSDRLPDSGTEVFVYLFNIPSPYIAWVTDGRWYTEDFEVEKEDYPVAWMPLPEPVKLENEI